MGANDKEAVGHFKYQNVGTEPIHFKSMRASFGCTTAQSQKEEVAPGEHGEITATFQIGDWVDLQVKTITVQTDEATRAVTVLTLKAVLLGIRPIFVYWEAGETPKPKTIFVRSGKVRPVKQLTVSSSSPDFQAKVQQIGNGAFTIDIEPKETAHPMVATLTIHPDNLAKTFYANARVTNVPVAQ